MEKTVRFGISALYLPLHEMAEEVHSLNEAGIEFFHLDFFDGNYVDNLGMSLADLALIRRYTSAELDVHMSVNRPGRFLHMLKENGADTVYIHPDADPQPAATLQEIQKLGMNAGIAVSPSLSVASVEELLPLTDRVLVMAVHPGVVGQSYQRYIEPKLMKFLDLQDEYGYEIVLDGGVTEDVVARLKQHKISMILGTILIKAGRDRYKEIVERLKED